METGKRHPKIIFQLWLIFNVFVLFSEFVSVHCIAWDFQLGSDHSKSGPREFFFFVHILSKERRRKKNGVKWQSKLSWMANFQKRKRKNKIDIVSLSDQRQHKNIQWEEIGAGGGASGRTVESVNNSCLSLSRPTRGRYSFVCGLN